MDINFVLRCLFSLVLAKALLVSFPKSRAMKQASYWLVVWAVASGLLAFLADDPYGYSRLWSGPIHLLFAFIAFISVMVAMVLLDRQLLALKCRKLVTNGLVLLTIVAVFSFLLLGRAGFRPHGLGGLYERLFLGSVLLWELSLALVLRKHQAKRQTV